MVDLAGGIPKYISLVHPKGVCRSENWVLDLSMLEQMVSEKTKAIIINNPNNPLGKVWHRDELESLTKVIIRHNLLCISDEVYEHLVYKPLDTGFTYIVYCIRFITLPPTPASSRKHFLSWRI